MAKNSMKSYVQVLSDLTPDDANFLEAVSEFEELSRVFWSDQLLKDFLCSPAIQSDVREKILRSCLENAQLNSVVIKMVVLMLRKNVILNLPSFILSLRDHADERCNIARGLVYTAVKLSASAQDKVAKVLSDWMKKTTELEFVDQPQILGGLKVSMKNIVLDASLQGKLNEAKTKLKSKRA